MTTFDAHLRKQIPALVRARTTQFAVFDRTYPNPTRAKLGSFARKNWDPYPTCKTKFAAIAMLFSAVGCPGHRPGDFSRGVAPGTPTVLQSLPFPTRIFPSNPKLSMILGSPKAFPARLRCRSAKGRTSNFSGGARFAPWPAPLALVGLLPCSCHTQVFF
jgi:hypothetical protein